MSTHLGEDVLSLFKVLKAYFEDQGTKFYSQEEVDGLVAKVLESAPGGNTRVLFPAADVQEQIDSLKNRVLDLESKVQRQSPEAGTASGDDVSDTRIKATSRRAKETAARIARYDDNARLARMDRKAAWSKVTNELRDELDVDDLGSEYSKSFYGTGKDAVNDFLSEDAMAS